MIGTVFNIQRFSINDGPGIRTTVFLKGCPLNCHWCHNPESILPHKEIIIREDRCIGCGECFLNCNYFAIKNNGNKYITDRKVCTRCGRCVEVCFSDARAIIGKEMSTDEVIQEVEKDLVFYNQSNGGVTFSGGEPFSQPEFLIELLKKSKQKNLHTTVDTSGYTSEKILREASDFTDLYLFDIKSINDSLHKSFTGVSNKLILENLKKLVDWKMNIIVRVPIIPTINDRLDEIRQIGNFVKSLESINEIHILPYHSSGIEKYKRIGKQSRLELSTQLSQEKLDMFANELKNFVSYVVVGG